MEDANSVAASSPATEVAVPTNSGAYAKWRMTGELPKSEASAPSKETSGAGEEPAASAPASEAGKTQQEKKPRSSAETRLNELLADLKTAGYTPAELKSLRREAQQTPSKSEPQPKAAPEQTAKPAAGGPPVKPKQDDFKTWDEYEAAKEKYNEDLVDYKSKKAVDDYRAQQAQEAMNRDLKTKMDDARTRYGDEAESTIVGSAQAIFNDEKVSPVIKAILNESTILTDVLYALGSKADIAEFVALAKASPGQAIRKLALIEHLVTEELARGGKAAAKAPAAGEASERDESGKFTPAKKVTEAPPPPRETSGHAAPPPDEVEAAVKADDFTRFRNAANRKDLARRRGN
jgi:hypothetical protein